MSTHTVYTGESPLDVTLSQLQALFEEGRSRCYFSRADAVQMQIPIGQLNREGYNIRKKADQLIEQMDDSPEWQRSVRNALAAAQSGFFRH